MVGSDTVLSAIAEIKANQEQMKANQEQMKEEEMKEELKQIRDTMSDTRSTSKHSVESAFSGNSRTE